MVDNLNPQGEPGIDAPASSSGLAGFVRSTPGKILIGSFMLIILLGVIAFIVFTFVLQPTPDDALAPLPPAGGGSVATGTAGAPSQEASPTYRNTQPLSDTFTFRDIFVPRITPASTSSDASETGGDTVPGGGDGTTTGTAIPNVPRNTLYLESISTEDGEPVATFIWNGARYTAGEGERLGTTPWQVVSIEGNTVIMLFGDSRVTLTLGQGVVTK